MSDAHIEFSVGDRVQFTRCYARGASIGLKLMEGTIHSFSQPKGLKAFIKYHGGNYVWKKVSDIRLVRRASAQSNP